MAQANINNYSKAIDDLLNMVMRQNHVEYQVSYTVDQPASVTLTINRQTFDGISQREAYFILCGVNASMGK